MVEAKKTRANGRASRKAILVAALEVFAERGHRGTSLTEIANRVGMTQPGLLHHFGTKEQLLLEVVEAQEERTAELNMPHLQKGDFHLKEAIETLGTLNQELAVEQQLLATLSTEAIPADHPLHDHFVNEYRDRRKRLAQSIRAEQKAGRVRADVDTAAVAREIIATLDGLRLQWLLDPDKVSLKQALATYATRITDELAP
jgi:AcrR family transcriptional regulator